MNLKYFAPDEFENASPPCHLSDMNPAFMERLDRARVISGVPYKINSAFRSSVYEREHGRHLSLIGPHSVYPCVAVDIKCCSGFERLSILKGLISVGFSRIGIGSTFIHVDDVEDKAPSVWLY